MKRLNIEDNSLISLKIHDGDIKGEYFNYIYLNLSKKLKK